MTGPDLRVLAALRRRRLDADQLRRETRLAVATLTVTLRKLVRMKLVAHDGARYRLTAKGRTRERSTAQG